MTSMPMTSKQRRYLFGSLWIGFVIYAFLLAPPNDPETLAQIVALSTGQWSSLNPLIVALFNLMGVWPMAYAALLLQDGHCQKTTNHPALATTPKSSTTSQTSSEGNPAEDSDKSIKAWPFVLGSFGLGAFALLPYLMLRSATPNWDSGKPSKLIRVLDSRWFGLFLLANALVWLLYGLTQGDWSNFVEQWHNSRFIHVMSLDFCALTLLFPSLAWDDARRHGWVKPQWVWATATIPILGASLYLCARPPLQGSFLDSPSELTNK